jgi:hypothetical protein
LSNPFSKHALSICSYIKIISANLIKLYFKATLAKYKRPDTVQNYGALLWISWQLEVSAVLVLLSHGFILSQGFSLCIPSDESAESISSTYIANQ